MKFESDNYETVCDFNESTILPEDIKLIISLYQLVRFRDEYDCDWIATYSSDAFIQLKKLLEILKKYVSDEKFEQEFLTMAKLLS